LLCFVCAHWCSLLRSIGPYQHLTFHTSLTRMFISVPCCVLLLFINVPCCALLVFVEFLDLYFPLHFLCKYVGWKLGVFFFNSTLNVLLKYFILFYLFEMLISKFFHCCCIEICVFRFLFKKLIKHIMYILSCVGVWQTLAKTFSH